MNKVHKGISDESHLPKKSKTTLQGLYQKVKKKKKRQLNHCFKKFQGFPLHLQRQKQTKRHVK